MTAAAISSDSPISASGQETIVRVQNVDKVYKSAHELVYALRGINLRDLTSAASTSRSWDHRVRASRPCST